MNNFISVEDVHLGVNALVQKAIEYKNNPTKDNQLGAGKRLGLLFLNPSLRTRVSTQIAAQNLGMDVIVLNASQDSWQLEFEDGAIMNDTKVEHIKDAAPIFGEYFDIFGVRTFPQLIDRDKDYSEYVIKAIQKHAKKPIISLESATLHPLQSLADIMTINENWTQKKKPKVVLTWAPHIKPIPQCVANSFAQWINKWGETDFTITHPEGFELDEKFTKGATITHDQDAALQDADFVYVKNWSSYKDYGKVLTDNEQWMLTSEKLKNTTQAKVMHCLPVRRNVELSDEVLDHPNSLTTEQASNRVWAAQSILSHLLKTS